MEGINFGKVLFCTCPDGSQHEAGFYISDPTKPACINEIKISKSPEDPTEPLNVKNKVHCRKSASCQMKCMTGHINLSQGGLDQVCEICDYPCHNCFDQKNKCLSCQKGFYFVPDGDKCEPCHKNCMECD